MTRIHFLNFLKGLRRRKWERAQRWDNEELDRVLDSKDALPEQIQDYEREMVIIGSDVVSLYPNLEVEGVVQRVKEAIMESDMKWDNFDYLEGVRYIALNWTQEECNRSELRRVLPVRRGRRGSRPTIKEQVQGGGQKETRSSGSSKMWS